MHGSAAVSGSQRNFRFGASLGSPSEASMAAPYWKGYLKLSLVTCPVAIMPATTVSEKIKFHTLNRSTGNGIRSRYVDSQTGKVVDDEEEVKG